MKTLMQICGLTVATIGLAATTTSAIAGNADQSMLSVKTSDLNLDTQEGQRTLDRRIEAAARKVCNYQRVRTGTRIRPVEERQCFDRAVASARTQFAEMIKDKQRGG